MLSITWVNRGNDGFDAAYGANAGTARTLVDEAIANWQVVTGSKPKIKLQINAGDLSSLGAGTLGVTKGSSIRIDDSADGKGWYFDPDINDDTELLKPIGGTNSGFIAKGNMGGHYDFYTTALHEIGHALGFSDKRDPYVFYTGKKKKKDPSHSGDQYDLMYPANDVDTRREISIDDATMIRYKIKSLSNLPQRFLILSATVVDNGISLSWTGADDVSTYYIYRSSTYGGSRAASNPQLVHTGNGMNGQWLDLDVTAGSTYRYWVSFSAPTPFGGNISWDSQAATDAYFSGSSTGNNTPPQQPNGFPGTISVSTDQPMVVIHLNAKTDFNQWSVYRSTVNNGSLEASGAQLLFTRKSANIFWDVAQDTTANPGTTYYYWFKVAFVPPGSDQAGFQEWDFGPYSGSSTGFSDPVIQTSMAGSKVHLSWQPLNNVYGYEVYAQGTDNPYTSSLVASPTTNSADIDLTEGMEYTFNVVADFSQVGQSWDVKQLNYPGKVKFTPTYWNNTPIATDSRKEVFVYWKSLGSGVDHYDIYRSNVNKGDYQSSGATLIGSSPADAPHFIDAAQDLLSGYSYYYWVLAAYHDSGPSIQYASSSVVRGIPIDSGSTGNAGGSVSATQGIYHDFVRVTFNLDPYVSYESADIYRSTVNNGRPEFSNAVLLGAVAPNSWTRTYTYDDSTAVPGQSYYYWIYLYNNAGSNSYDLVPGAAVGYR